MNYQDLIRSQSESLTIQTDSRQIFAIDLVESIHELTAEMRELRKLLQQSEPK